MTKKPRIEMQGHSTIACHMKKKCEDLIESIINNQ